MPTYQLRAVVYLDNKNECYKKIVIINQKPQGPLQSLVNSLHIPKPSPFKTSNNCCPSPYCHQAIMHPIKTKELLCMSEIADLNELNWGHWKNPPRLKSSSIRIFLLH